MDRNSAFRAENRTFGHQSPTRIPTQVGSRPPSVSFEGLALYRAPSTGFWGQRLPKIDFPLIVAAIGVAIVIVAISATTESLAAYWTATFTAALTLSTILLWLATNRLARGAEEQAKDMKASVAAAEKSAAAASTAAQALPKLERSYLVFVTPGALHVTRPGYPVMSTKVGEITPMLENYGKTPAIPKRYRCGILIHKGIPTPAILDTLPILAITRAAIRAGGGFEEKIPVEHTWAALNVDHSQTYLIGVLEYEDVFGGQHETCFCYRLAKRGEFERADDVPQLNYHR